MACQRAEVGALLYTHGTIREGDRDREIDSEYKKRPVRFA
jgi:hypothetical protein